MFFCLLPKRPPMPCNARYCDDIAPWFDIMVCLPRACSVCHEALLWGKHYASSISLSL